MKKLEMECGSGCSPQLPPSRLRHVIAVCLVCICTDWTFGQGTAIAGVKSKAALEAAEYLLRKFGKETAKEGVETLAKRLESLAVRHGDDALNAARKVGPRAIQAIEQAGSHGAKAARLLARQGNRALWIIENPKRLKLFAQYGDEAAEAMLKHKGLAEPLISSLRQPASKALVALNGKSARRLALMAQEGSLSAIGRSKELLKVISRFGDRGMAFVWKHKKALAVAATLAAFLSNPQPFIDGTVDLATGLISPVAVEAAKSADWTWLGLAVIGAASAYATVRLLLRARSSRRWSRPIG